MLLVEQVLLLCDFVLGSQELDGFIAHIFQFVLFLFNGFHAIEL